MADSPRIPVTFGHWVIDGGKLSCKLPRKTLAIRAPRKLLLDVVNFCDGSRKWDQVLSELEQRWETKALSAFLTELADAGALVDASLVLANWADIAQLPTVTLASAEADEIGVLHLVAEKRLLPGCGSFIGAIRYQKNPLANLLEGRQSSRTFFDESISVESLHAILWAAHGVTGLQASGPATWHRTIASGGSIHGARWFVVVLRELKSKNSLPAFTAPGIYEARFHQLGGVSLEKVVGDFQHAWHCLLDPRVLTFASALVLPVCNFVAASRKYGNRAVLYALMEVGQALQNAQLMAVQVGASSIVRGDAIGHQILNLIGLDTTAEPAHVPFAMPAMVVGAKASKKQVQQQLSESFFKISPGLSVSADSFAYSATPAAGPFLQHFVGGGRSANPTLALTKAESEGWERQAWANQVAIAGIDFEIGKFSQVNAPIDPRLLVAYSQNQYARTNFPLVRFSTNKNYLWAKAIDARTGKTHGVLADCVYAHSALPRRFQRTAYANASTSGLAAGVSFDEALSRATLELIERDAFVCAWLGAQAPPVISPMSLPSSARRRIQELSDCGFRIVISNISTGWVPVVSVFAQSSRLPLTTITAAAHFSAEQALEKALDEAETQIACAKHYVPAKDDSYPMRRIERYYRCKRTYRRSDFYADSDNVVTFKSADRNTCKTWSKLQARIFEDNLDLLAVDMSPKDAAIGQGRLPLYVVRAFVPGLLPIWFEAGMQPRGMARFLKYTAASARRHAGQAFIHPFT